MVFAVLASSPLPGTGGPPTMAQAAGRGNLTVATYNICRPMVCPARGGSWEKRRAAILRTLAVVKPDILALQELDDVDGTAMEMARALERRGYGHANPAAGPAGRSGIARCVPVMCSNQLFYRRDTVSLLEGGRTPSAGNAKQSQFAPRSLFSGVIKDRPQAWAAFRLAATSEPLLVVGVHLAQRYEGQGSTFVRARRARLGVAEGVPGWIKRKAADLGIPGAAAIILGDANSYAAKEPDGPQRIWSKNGFTNTEGASRRINADAPTINLMKRNAHFEGFPPRVERFGRDSPKIDVIMTRGLNRASLWEIFLRTRDGGRFVEKYRGSDHNLVRAVIPL